MPYLVRHAHAGDKRTWDGPDLLRPLSDPGRREAHGLLTQLRDYSIGRILSSPAVRCVQTVEPLARRRGLRVERTEVLGVDSDPDVLLALLVDPAAGEAVLCSHGELIGTVLERLVGHVFDTGGQLTWPKGSAWVLDMDGGQVTHSRYLPPLRLQDTQAGYYWNPRQHRAP
jgi:phosphohistidine phosphatase SixA